MQEREVLEPVAKETPTGEGCSSKPVSPGTNALRPVTCRRGNRRSFKKGFAVLPRRWVVERTFSWFGRNRRIAKDYKNLGLTLAAFVTLVCIQIAVRRLAR